MIYRFGDLHYDSAQRLLFRGAERVPLEPKALDTLHVLIERRGQVVEKAELLRLVWPDTTVEDVGLARNISLLRKALGSDDFIETVPRRGYRFVAELNPTPAPRRWLAPALLALALAGFLYYEFYVPSPYVSRGPGPHLAVVPFTCLCPGIDGAALSQGLNELLVAELVRSGGWNLISPGTVDRYRRFSIPMSMMGRVLGLDTLLEGTIQKLGSRALVTARLVDVRSGRLIWAESYERDASDLRSLPAPISNSLKMKVLSASSK